MKPHYSRTCGSFIADESWKGVCRWPGNRPAMTRQPGAGAGSAGWPDMGSQGSWGDRASAEALAWHPGS